MNNRGAGIAGKSALRASRIGARWAREQGGELIDRIPVDRIEHDVRETVGAARDRIDGFVQQDRKSVV